MARDDGGEWHARQWGAQQGEDETIIIIVFVSRTTTWDIVWHLPRLGRVAVQREGVERWEHLSLEDVGMGDVEVDVQVDVEEVDACEYG